MAKFFAPGRGGDFCKLSVCQKLKSTLISVLPVVLRKTKLELLFCIFVSYYLPCNENVVFWDLTLFTFPRQHLGPDYMRPVRTLTGTTQTGSIKFTWARSESMKWLHETGTRLQIGRNVYMKDAGRSYFPFVVCFIVPFIVKCISVLFVLLDLFFAHLFDWFRWFTHCRWTKICFLAFPALTLSFVILNTTSQHFLRSQDLYLHIRSLVLPVLQSNPQPSTPKRSNEFDYL